MAKERFPAVLPARAAKFPWNNLNIIISSFKLVFPPTFVKDKRRFVSLLLT